MTVNEKVMLAQMAITDAKTNHVLHLLLSVFTVGLWLIPWFIIAGVNERKRINAKKRMKKALRGK